MKRLLLLLALCLIIGSAVAAPLTFQNENDANAVTLIGIGQGAGPGFPERSTTAGNQYIWPKDLQGVQNKNAVPFTYAAWTSWDNGYFDNVYLGDATNTTIATLATIGYPAPIRYEVVVTGSTARLYGNGILLTTSGALATNPSYVRYQDVYGAIGRPSFDDFILGGLTDSRYVIGMPAQDGYYLKKDLISPPSSGLYNASNDALVDSNNMYTTWGRSNVSGEALVNESMTLQNVDTGTVYETHYTGFATAGTTTWNVATSLFVAGAPYGFYQTKLGTTVSDTILYVASGATIYFDSTTYGRGNTAQMTYSVDGAYWDTSTYTYHVNVYSASTGALLHSYTLTSSSGTDTYTFTSTDPEGVVYAVVTRTLNTGGSDDWLAYDYATLTGNAKFTGYVNDAQTKLPITAANVSLVQGSIISNNITGADGYYSSVEFLTGALVSVNVTAANHKQYTYSFTPLIGKTVNLNMTLIPMTPAVNGLAIGGVVRDTAYGQPIGSALAEIANATSVSENTSNSAGYYLINDTLNLSSYNVHGSKAGYSNSSTYNVSVNGSVSNFTQNDIWMAGQYSEIFHITASDTGLPINIVQITSSDGQVNTTFNGTGYLTEPLGIYNIAFASTGYDVKTVAYVFDSDGSYNVQLVKSTATVPYAVTYPPKDVRFHLQTIWGQALSGATVSANANQTTLGNYSYVASLFGYTLSAVPLNTLTLQGVTDSRGDITFAMMSNVQYAMNYTLAGYTFPTGTTITPHDDNYIIYANSAGSTFIANGTAPQASVVYTVQQNRTNVTSAKVFINYTDIAGSTTGGIVSIYRTNSTFGNNSPPIEFANETFAGNFTSKNYTFIDTVTASCPASNSTVYNGTGSAIGCFNVTLVNGESCTAKTIGYTPSGNVAVQGSVWFRNIASPIAALSLEFALFMALGIMMVMAMMAGISTAPPISLAVTFGGWIFYGMNMLNIIDTVVNISGIQVSSVATVLEFMTLISILYLFVAYRRSGK